MASSPQYPKYSGLPSLPTLGSSMGDIIPEPTVEGLPALSPLGSPTGPSAPTPTPTPAPAEVPFTLPALPTLGAPIAPPKPTKEHLTEIWQERTTAEGAEPDEKPDITVGRILGAGWEGIKDVSRMVLQNVIGWGEVKEESLKGLDPEKRGMIQGAIRGGFPIGELWWRMTEPEAQPYFEQTVQALQNRPEYRGISSGFLEDLVRTAPQFGAQILAYAATGVAGAMTFMGLQIAGSTYERLREEGVEPQRAMSYGLVNAIIQAPIETVPFARAVGIWKPQRMLLQRLRSVVETMGTEAATEYVQEYVDEVINVFATNPDQSAMDRLDLALGTWEKVGKVHKRAIHAAKIAGTLAGIMGTGAAAIRAKQQKKAEEEIGTELEKVQKTVREIALRAKAEAPPPTMEALQDAAIAKEAMPLRAQLALRMEQEETLDDVAPGKFLPALQAKLIKDGQTKEDAVKQIKSIAGRYTEAYEDITKGEVFYMVGAKEEKITPKLPKHLDSAEKILAVLPKLSSVEALDIDLRLHLLSNVQKGEALRKLWRKQLAHNVAKKYPILQLLKSEKILPIDEINKFTAVLKESQKIHKDYLSGKYGKLEGVVGKAEWHKAWIEKYAEMIDVLEKKHIKPIAKVGITAKFIGYQETGLPGKPPVPLYNIITGPEKGRTVGRDALIKKGIEIPKTPPPTVKEALKKPPEPIKSKGHVGFTDKFEYFFIENGNLYRAPKGNSLDVNGIRQGARFESTAAGAEAILEQVELKKPPITKAKEPWEMTRKEFLQIPTEEMRKYNLRNETHESLIQDALAEGKPIPKEVLAEYPELKKKEKIEPTYERITRRQEEMDKKYAPLVGTRIKDRLGQEWEFKSTNDLGIPYFVKVVKGKAQKKEFTVSEFGKEWLDKRLVKEEPPITEVKEPPFKKWFGKSKVVDDKGDPLVVHHGDIREKITILRPEEAIETEGVVFFSDSEDVASIFQYPREYGELVTAVYNEETGEYEDIEPGILISAYLKLTNPLILEGEEAQRATDDTAYQGEIVKKAKANKHDGVIFKDVEEGVGDVIEKGTTYGVFATSQIRPVPISTTAVERPLGVLPRAGDWVYDAAGEEAIILYIEKDKAYVARDGTAKETRLVPLSDLSPTPPDSTQYSVQTVEPININRFRDIQGVLKEWPKILTKAGASTEDIKYFKVQVADTLALDAAENAQKSLKEWQNRGVDPTPANIIAKITLRGMHATIELSRNVATGFTQLEGALYHEYYHWAKRFKIPGNIRARMDKYYANNEETEANEFRDYIRDNNFHTDAPNWLRQEWLKLKRFLQMLGEWLRGNGFFRPEDVFGQLRVGAFGTRPMTHMAINRAVPSMSVQQRLLSESTKEENFLEWFKNSKVLDANGEPLMVFHGTFDPIAIFEHSKNRTIGFHFGTIKQAAARATSRIPQWGASMIPAHINITNPLRMRDIGFGTPLGVVNALYEHKIINVSTEIKLTRQIKKLSKQVVEWAPADMTYKIWNHKAFEIVRNHLKSLGYDGIVYKNEYEGPGDSYIAFDSSQIKSVFNTGTWAGSEPHISYNVPRTPVPWAFSALTHAVETGLPAGKVPAKVDSLRNWLARVAKPSELLWVGVDGWITDNAKEGKVDRKEFLKFLQGNAIELGEVLRVSGENVMATAFEEIRPGFWQAWDTYTQQHITIERTSIEEGVSYALSSEFGEYLLGVYPTFDEAVQAATEEDFNIADDLGAKYSSFTLPGGENYSELLFTYDPKANAKELESYVWDHFKIDIYHPSISEADRKAYTQKFLTQEEYNGPHWQEPNVLAHVRFDDRYAPDGRKILFLEEVQSDWLQQAKKDAWESAPKAPFLHNWHEVVMKRMLRHAAENGYDVLAWTTGKQQADIYDLRKYVDSIEYYKEDEDLWDFKTTQNGRTTSYHAGKSISQVEDYVGPDIAQRMIKGEGKSIVGRPVKILSGLDLTMGGEGMIAFYDELLPGFMKKYVKQWGGKVETGEVKVGITEVTPPAPPIVGGFTLESVHMTAITPPMRDSVRYVGQTFFSVRQSQDINDLYRNRGITGPLKDLYQQHIGNPLWNYFSEDLPINMGEKSEVIDKINKGIITDYRKDPKFISLRDDTMFKIANLKEKAKELAESIQKLSVPEQMRAAQIIRGSITTQSEKYQSALEIVKHFKRLETDLKDLGILGPDNRFTQLNRKEINRKFMEISSLDKQITKLVQRLKPIVQVKINARKASKDISEKLIVRDVHTTMEPITRISRWSELNENRVREALTNRGYATGEIDQMIKRIKESVEPLAGTTGEVTTIRETLEKTITKTITQAITTMKSFSPAYMAKARGAITKDINKLTKERQAILERIRLHYHMSGKQYLRRAYKKIEEEKTWLGRIRSYVSKRHRLIRGYDVRRQDLSYEYRQQLEEIKTAPFLAYKGLSEETHDRELMRLFNIVAANKDWAISPGEWENIQSIEARARLREKYAKFKPLPINPKKLGPLSGALIDPYIWDDLNQAVESKSDMLKGYESLLSLWKTGKVVYNPATQCRNVLSNTILAFFAGLPPWKVQVYAKAASDMLNKTGYYSEAKSTPLMGTEWAGAEVKRFLSDAAALKEGNFMTESHKLIRSILDKPAATYQGIEQFFKLAVFINERQAGRTIKQAAKHAEGAIFNYQKIPPAIRWAKRWYSPFITFSFKALPKFAETAIRAPWRVAGLLILLKGVEELSRRFLGESDEELEREKTILPEYMRKALFPGIISHLYLPYRDKYNRSKWLDLSYIMPWGDVAEQWGQSHLVGRPFLPSHPLWITVAEVGFNHVFFTGQDLTIKDVDEGSDYMKKIGIQIWRQAMPSLAGSYSFNKLITALTGEKDWAGRERSFTEAIFDTLLGLKVRSIDYNEQYAFRLRDFRRMISDIKGEFRRDYRRLMNNPTEDTEKNQKRFERLYKKTNDKLEKITEKILEIYRGGKE